MMIKITGDQLICDGRHWHSSMLAVGLDSIHLRITLVGLGSWLVLQAFTLLSLSFCENFIFEGHYLLICNFNLKRFRSNQIASWNLQVATLWWVKEAQLWISFHFPNFHFLFYLIASWICSTLLVGEKRTDSSIDYNLKLVFVAFPSKCDYTHVHCLSHFYVNVSKHKSLFGRLTFI